MLGIAAPMKRTLTSPITGITVDEGEVISGACAPEKLEVVGFGPWRPGHIAAVKAVLEERRAVRSDD